MSLPSSASRCMRSHVARDEGRDDTLYQNRICSDLTGAPPTSPPSRATTSAVRASRRPRSRARTRDPGAAQAAIAVRILREILLMIFLGVIKFGGGDHLGGNASAPRLVVRTLILRQGRQRRPSLRLDECFFGGV